MTKLYREPSESIMSRKCGPNIATRLVNSVPLLGGFKLQKSCYQPCSCIVLLLLLLLLFIYFFFGGGGSFKTTFELAHASCSLPEWQAVKLPYFAPCSL